MKSENEKLLSELISRRQSLSDGNLVALIASDPEIKEKVCQEILDEFCDRGRDGDIPNAYGLKLESLLDEVYRL